MSELPNICDMRALASYFYLKKETSNIDSQEIFDLLTNYNGKSVVIKSSDSTPTIIPIVEEKQKVEQKLENVSDQRQRTRLLNYLSTLNRCPIGKSIVCQQNS